MTSAPITRRQPGRRFLARPRWALWPGGLSLLVIGVVLAAAAYGLGRHWQILNPLELVADPYLQRVTGFTLLQASLSTLLATAVAIPAARALARRPQLPGRRLFLQLASLSLIMPTIVGVFGIVAVHGRSGWANGLLGLIGFDGGSYLYGLTGILLAHVFFNGPLLTRIFLQSLESIPPEYWRIAAQLDLKGGDIFRLIEWPVLRKVLPAAGGLIFLLCFTSFIIVLALGGGPGSNTLEVAIYQALRFDFDIPRAVALAFLQLVLCALFLIVGTRFARHLPLASTEGQSYTRPDSLGWRGKSVDTLALLVLALLVFPPLAAALWQAITPRMWNVLSDPKLWQASLTSLQIALAAGLLSLLLALGLAQALTSLRLPHRYAAKRGSGKLAALIDLCGSVVLLLPPFVLATGLFIALKDHASLQLLAPALVVVVNALLALPFALRVLAPAVEQAAERSDRLCASLGIAGLDRLRLIDWPQCRKALGLTLGLTCALSTGDLSVIALFGTQDFTTLPLLMYRNMGAYRLEEAAVIAAFLCIQSLTLFIVIEGLIAGQWRLPHLPSHRLAQRAKRILNRAVS